MEQIGQIEPFEEIVIKEEPLQIDIDFFQDADLFQHEKESPVVPQDQHTQPVNPLAVQTADPMTSSSPTLHISMCRICLKDRLLTPIFQPEQSSMNKFDTAARIAFVCPMLRKVKESDGYPQYICLSCSANLNVAFKFIQLAVASDRVTSEFHPVPNGILTKEPLPKPQVRTNLHVYPHKTSPRRKCFRHKAYVAKDLTRRTVYNFKGKRTRGIDAHHKVMYSSKDLPQKNSSKAIAALRSSLSCYGTDLLHLETWMSQNGIRKLSKNRELSQLSCIPAVTLNIDNVLFCLNCKMCTENGICSKCGPIRAILSVCYGCKGNYRRHIEHNLSMPLCLECRKEFMTLSLPLPTTNFQYQTDCMKPVLPALKLEPVRSTSVEVEHFVL